MNIIYKINSTRVVKPVFQRHRFSHIFPRSRKTYFISILHTTVPAQPRYLCRTSAHFQSFSIGWLAGKSVIHSQNRNTHSASHVVRRTHQPAEKKATEEGQPGEEVKAQVRIEWKRLPFLARRCNQIRFINHKFWSLLLLHAAKWVGSGRTDRLVGE